MTDDPIVRLAEHHVGASAGSRPALACPEIVTRLRDLAAAGRDAEIAAILRLATSPEVRRCLWESLDRALAPDASAGVVTQLFALPLAIVTGGRAPASVPGVLADVARVRDILQGSGVLGQARNFGLGNGLCTAETLEALPPSRVYALGREAVPGMLDLPPAEITVATSDEHVHLRFLPGAVLTAADAPGFLETSSAIGTWGMALTRELAHQLRVEGLSVLPLPRPPATLMRAPRVGRAAGEELAYQTFVSRVLRKFRAEVGEPAVTVAALDSGAVGVRFASPLGAAPAQLHVRPLHPLDDLHEVAAGMLGLLRECRVQNVEVLPTVVSVQALLARRA